MIVATPLSKLPTAANTELFPLPFGPANTIVSCSPISSVSS